MLCTVEPDVDLAQLEAELATVSMRPAPPAWSRPVTRGNLDTVAAALLDSRAKDPKPSFSDVGPNNTPLPRLNLSVKISALTPDVHIYTRSKLPWVTVPDGVPAVEVYYDTKALWPASSLERLKATRRA